jgi:hypothetical protein
MHTIDKYKAIIERDFKGIGEPIPQGFAITYNEETQLVKAFLDAESYRNLKEPEDVVYSHWNGKEWEGK